MTGVLDRIPENNLPSELARRVSEADELKGSFQSVGATSVVTSRVFSTNVFDIQFTASSTAGTTIIHRADIEFKPSDMTFGGAFCHRMNARIMDTSNSSIYTTAPMIERRVTNDGTQKWSIYHVTFGYPSDSIRVKFYFFTTGSGTFTATVIH